MGRSLAKAAVSASNMATTDSISVFTEGTFEEQVNASLSYLTHDWYVYRIDPRTCELCRPKSIRGGPSGLYQALSRRIQNSWRSETIGGEYWTPARDLFHGSNPSKRLWRRFWKGWVDRMNSSGDDRWNVRSVEIEGFFNLLYSHLFTWYPAGSAEEKRHLTALLEIISSGSQDHAPTTYRMQVQSHLTAVNTSD